jgi:predicted RNase H-like nuclease (RuvC/YqgF family)
LRERKAADASFETMKGHLNWSPIMPSAPNESPAQSAYDEHEARLTNVEKAVTDLQCDNALLRQQMASGFAAAQAQLALTEEKLRREFHDGLHSLEQRLSAQIATESQRLESKFSNEIQSLAARMDRQDARMDRLDAKIDRLDTKIDQLAKWLIGAQVTTMAFVIGIAVQLFLR